MNSFWENLKKVDFSNKQNLNSFLREQWGNPVDEVQTNLLLELNKKIFSYYGKDPFDNNITVYNFIGTIDSVSDIVEKKFKEGKRMGQIKYILKMENEIFEVWQENLKPEKWDAIQKFAIVGRKSVFKYKKRGKDNQIIDFYPYENDEPKKVEQGNNSDDSLQSKLNEKNPVDPTQALG